MVTMSCLDLSASALNCLFTDIPGESYLHASVAIQKLRCIVRKLLSKRKFNSSSLSTYAPEEPVKALAVAVWTRSTQFLSLLTPHRGSVMVITDAAGSDHGLRGIDATRKKQRLASLRLPGRSVSWSGATTFSLAMRHASGEVLFCFTWLL